MTAILAVLALAACHKKGGSTGGGGGGGGAWLVGRAGLMANLRADGTQGPGYALATDADLTGIACRGSETAWVVGEAGTLLRTTDAGHTWVARSAGTSAALRDVAASWNEIFVAGDDGLRVSRDTGDSWSVIAPGAWLAVATDDGGEVALALAADGSVWRYESGALVHVTGLAGARALALSHDGGVAAVVGDSGALRSDDGGVTWGAGPGAGARAVAADTDGSILTAPGAIALRIDADGEGYAAQADGTILRTDDGGATWDTLAVKIPGVLDLDDIDLGD